MSNMERAIKLLESLPEYKIAYVIGYIQGLDLDLDNEMSEIEEIEPDEWDLAMLEEAKKENNGEGIPIEALAAKLGVRL